MFQQFGEACYNFQTECFFTVHSASNIPQGAQWGVPLTQIGMLQLNWLTDSGVSGGLVNDSFTWGSLPSLTTTTTLLPVSYATYRSTFAGTIVVGQPSAGKFSKASEILHF